jgi:hypothetical protein
MDVSPPLEYPRVKGSPVLDLPLQSEGPDPFFPPVCLQSHWDPTKVLRWTLPRGYVAQPLDPRPWTRICMEYTTAGEALPAPDVDPNIVMPSGGQFYPPNRYSAAIDDETKLRRMDRPLGTCEADQWLPGLKSDMFNSRILVPERQNPVNPMRIEELAYPRALIREGPYECRAQADAVNERLSSDYLFNNATKQDRYKRMGKETKPAAPVSPLLAAAEKLPAWAARDAGRAEARLGSYEAAAASSRADLVANAKAPRDLSRIYADTGDVDVNQQLQAWRAARGLPPLAVRAGPSGTMDAVQFRPPNVS